MFHIAERGKNNKNRLPQNNKLGGEKEEENIVLVFSSPPVWCGRNERNISPSPPTSDETLIGKRH
jgi:hypothetical protein